MSLPAFLKHAAGRFSVRIVPFLGKSCERIYFRFPDFAAVFRSGLLGKITQKQSAAKNRSTFQYPKRKGKLP